MNFKFLTNNKPIQPPDNFYLMFNMDDALINVIRWLQYHNWEILNSDTYLSQVNVPINNCFIRITSWRRYDDVGAVEIDYKVIEANTRPIDFTFRMEEQEFQRRIDITGI
jgi:hypothetical protein